MLILDLSCNVGFKPGWGVFGWINCRRSDQDLFVGDDNWIPMYKRKSFLASKSAYDSRISTSFNIGHQV